MPRTLPALALRTQVLFPGQITQVTVGRGPSVAALDLHLDRKVDLVATLQLDPGLENPGPDDVAKVGVLCRVLRTMNLPDGSVRALVEVLSRCTVSDFHEAEREGTCCVPGRFAGPASDTKAVQAATRRVIELAREIFATSSPEKPPDALERALELHQEPERVCDHLAPQVGVIPAEAQELLEEPDLAKRMERLAWFMERSQQYALLKRTIADDVQKQMDAGQREYQLREQLKAIQK